MDDRKYRQQGYRKPAGSGDRRDEPRRSFPPSGGAPRPGGMLATRTVSRCGACGAVLPIANSSLEQCPQCRAPMHACLQCTHFDAAKRFECAEAVAERVADKNARNQCASYALRVSIERDSSPDGTRPGDIRRGFDNLFKK
ncbi:MAG: hypothetical protein FJ027_07360 [Candidatus Rokubacteria bacterium]|nr:hypothetical protein [Candidatus Rokubacteria bacterium]